MLTLATWVAWPATPSGSVELEPALVFGAGLEIQDRTGEAVGNGLVEILAPAINVFTANAEQRESIAPRRFTNRPELDADARIAVGVAVDGPFEAEDQEGRMFDVEAAGLGQFWA